MTRRPPAERRDELLELLVAECAAGGVGGRSLRELAQAVGTSHRMLIHHFGSREQLLLAVVQEVERRQIERLPGLPKNISAGFAAMWDELHRPELRGLERLFFECYARGAQGEQPFTHMVPSAVDEWLSAVESSRTSSDPALARLGLAVARGLLLDLVATDDDAGVDAAARCFVRMLQSRDRNRVPGARSSGQT